MGDAGGVRRHVASNPGGRWNSKWTFGKVDLLVFFPNSVDGVAVAWQGPFVFFSQKKHVPFQKNTCFLVFWCEHISSWKNGKLIKWGCRRCQEACGFKSRG